MLAASSFFVSKLLLPDVILVMAPKAKREQVKPTVVLPPAPKVVLPPATAEAASTASATTQAAVGAPTQAAVGAESVPALLVAKPWAALGVESGFLTDDVPCEDYVERVAASVRYQLISVLSLPPAAGGIDLEGMLHIQAPLKVAETLKGMDSYKEHWRWSNCKKSLLNCGLYSAPGNIFWIAVGKPTWLGRTLPAVTLTYGQLAAGRAMWSDEKFQRSNEDHNKRHYLLDEAMPTAINGLAERPTNCPDNMF